MRKNKKSIFFSFQVRIRVSFNISSSLSPQSCSLWSWLSMMGGLVKKVSTNNNWGTFGRSPTLLEQIIRAGWSSGTKHFLSAPTQFCGKKMYFSLTVNSFWKVLQGSSLEKDHWHLLKARHGTLCRWNRQHGNNSHPLVKPGRSSKCSCW